MAVLLKVFRRVERKGGRISADCEESPAESTTSMALKDESTEFGNGSDGCKVTASVVSSGSLPPHEGQNLNPCCNFEPH